MRLLSLTLSLTLVLSAGCAANHDVPLEIVGLDEGHPAGFACRTPTAMGHGPLLAELVAPRLATCAMSCARPFAVS